MDVLRVKPFGKCRLGWLGAFDIDDSVEHAVSDSEVGFPFSHAMRGAGIGSMVFWIPALRGCSSAT